MPPPANIPASPPSWRRPITLGALQVVVTMLLIGSAMSWSGGAAAGLLLCCAVVFVPFGILPALLAARRDPALTTGQGFSVAFIAVGLGMALWAMPVILSAPTPDARAIRKALVTWQEQVPPESKMTETALDDATRTASALLPYLPALHAAWTTILAGFVGMITVSRVQRSRATPRPPASPDRNPES